MINHNISSAPEGKKHRLSYSLILVVICLVIMTIVFGVGASFGVFFKPMLDEFGWTHAATSGPYALSFILYGITSLAAGRVIDRSSSGTKAVVTLGGILLGAGAILMSRISSLGHLYIFFGIMIGVGQGCTFTPIVAMISRWFIRRRSFINSIVISGIGLGIAIVPLMATQIMELLDWRRSLIIIGSVSLVIVVLLAQFLKGKPDVALPATYKNSPIGTVTPDKEIPLKKILRSGQFWLLCIAWLFYGICLQVAVVYIVPYAIGLGMSPVTSAGILTIIGAIGVVGRLGMGFAGDRLNKESIVMVGLVVIAGAYLGLSGIRIPGMLFVFAIVYGIFQGVGLFLSPIVAERFGIAVLGTVTGAVTLLFSFGGAIGPVTAGYLFDVSTSYSPGFLLSGIVGIGGGMIMWLLKRNH